MQQAGVSIRFINIAECLHQAGRRGACRHGYEARDSIRRVTRSMATELADLADIVQSGFRFRVPIRRRALDTSMRAREDRGVVSISTGDPVPAATGTAPRGSVDWRSGDERAMDGVRDASNLDPDAGEDENCRSGCSSRRRTARRRCSFGRRDSGEAEGGTRRDGDNGRAA